MKTRLKAFFKEIERYKDSTGYIVFHGNTAVNGKRIGIVKKLIEKRKIDPSRIVFVNGDAEKGIRTRLWIVRAGSDPSMVN